MPDLTPGAFHEVFTEFPQHSKVHSMTSIDNFF